MEMLLVLLALCEEIHRKTGGYPLQRIFDAFGVVSWKKTVEQAVA